jgi:hypothetical protein
MVENAGTIKEDVNELWIKYIDDYDLWVSIGINSFKITYPQSLLYV